MYLAGGVALYSLSDPSDGYKDDLPKLFKDLRQLSDFGVGERDKKGQKGNAG